MTVKEFVKEYKEAIDAKKYLEERLVRKYVSYNTKITKLEVLIDKTSILPIGEDRKIFKQNSPARFLIYTLMLIDSYTDIDVDFEKCVEEFDVLSEENLVGALLNIIPENERKTFQMLHDMIQGDYYENNRSLVGYLDGKIESANMLIEKILEEVEKNAEEETVAPSDFKNIE